MGNLFLTGARLFTGSFESSIYLLGVIGGVDKNVEVVPAINSNFSHHISAGLRDGSVITGQNAISHPSTSPTVSDEEGGGDPETPITRHRSFQQEISDHDRVEDANLPGSLPMLRKQNISFAKTHTPDLPSPIERIWYINPYGQEILPSPNPKVLQAIGEASCVVFSIGSLYTSIIPCLILKGVGSALRDRGIKVKVLILNGSNDRETKDYTAKDFVRAIVEACHGENNETSVSGGDSIEIRAEKGVKEEEWKNYVTHIVHLQGEGTPRVEKEAFKAIGIETLRIYGRKNEGGEGMIYDGVALRQALEVVMGKGGEKGRRMSLER